MRYTQDELAAIKLGAAEVYRREKVPGKVANYLFDKAMAKQDAAHKATPSSKALKIAATMAEAIELEQAKTAKECDTKAPKAKSKSKDKAKDDKTARVQSTLAKIQKHRNA